MTTIKDNEKNLNSDRVRSVVAIDEMWCLTKNLFNSTKEKLLRIEGIPKFEYLYMGNNNVFVFEKLLRLVEQSNIALDEDKGEIIKLIPAATIDIKEAIEIYGIIPNGYELRHFDDKIYMVNKSINAIIPVNCATNVNIKNDVIGKLIRGDVVESEEVLSNLSIKINHQIYTLVECRPSVARLTNKKPYINELLDCSGWFDEVLKKIKYQPSDFISENEFNQFKRIEIENNKDQRRIENLTREKIGILWETISNVMDVSSFNDSNDKLEDEEEISNANKLKNLYPELKEITSYSLYWVFNEYCDECLYLRYPEPHRDDDFVFYLLGLSSECGNIGYNILDIGKKIGFFILSGESFEVAKKSALDLIIYDRDISKQIHLIYDALVFLNTPDLAKKGKKLNPLLNRAKPIIITQKLSDFNLSSNIISNTD